MSKVYVGSGKVQTDRWLKCTINPDKLLEYVQEYNGNRFVKLNINILTEANKFGKDVEITVDTWQPGGQRKTEEKPSSDVVSEERDIQVDNNDDLPF